MELNPWSNAWWIHIHSLHLGMQWSGAALYMCATTCKHSIIWITHKVYTHCLNCTPPELGVLLSINSSFWIGPPRIKQDSCRGCLLLEGQYLAFLSLHASECPWGSCCLACRKGVLPKAKNICLPSVRWHAPCHWPLQADRQAALLINQHLPCNCNCHYQLQHHSHNTSLAFPHFG
jgi:hypothetical protein